MKIYEIIEQEQPQQPPPEEIEAVQDLIDTIDVTKERPQSLLNKLTGWMSAHPALDMITNIIPQTRLVKAIAAAVDALESGNKLAALNSLAGGLAGPVGGALKKAATAANVVTALNQPDPDLVNVARKIPGTVGQAAKGIQAVQKYQDTGDVGQAAQAYGGVPGMVATGAQLAKTLAPADDDLAAIRKNAGLAAGQSPA